MGTYWQQIRHVTMTVVVILLLTLEGGGGGISTTVGRKTTNSVHSCSLPLLWGTLWLLAFS